MVLLQWIRNNLFLNDIFNGRLRVLYLDNFCAHNQISECEDTSASIKTDIRKLPRNDTHLVQYCDSFVI